MDREAAVIREEMTRTRAGIDRKIALLEFRAKEMSPRRYWERHKPEYLLDRVIGAALTFAGLRMAWSLYRSAHARRARVRAALTSYGRS